MSDEGYCKMLKSMIIKKQRMTGEHEFKVSPYDRRLLVKYKFINGVSSTFLDHPEIRIGEDKNIAPRKYHIARINQ